MQGEARPKKTEEVSRYLAQAGVKGVRLVKGQSYFCFEGDATEDWIDHTVEVTFLGDLTCDQWLQTFRAMDANPANRKSIRAARE
jgi:hypothetical protein